MDSQYKPNTNFVLFNNLSVDIFKYKHYLLAMLLAHHFEFYSEF